MNVMLIGNKKNPHSTVYCMILALAYISMLVPEMDPVPFPVDDKGHVTIPPTEI